jgi:hypothetical protein
VAQYFQLEHRTDVGTPDIHAPQPGCPTDIDWHEVAAGLLPKLRARQLITHAAQCPHCGPLLRVAASDDEPTVQEEEFLAQLKAPSRPVSQPACTPALARRHCSIWQTLWDWKVLVPAAPLLLLAAVLTASRSSSLALSGTELAQFAFDEHTQHLKGNLALERDTDSQALLNQWLHEKSQFAVALPASSEVSPEQLPYRIEGARLIGMRSKTAVFIAYQMQPGPVSLIVTPASVALASGGLEVAFKKVSFHYFAIQGYKVVTWSVHGLTYALVSHEGSKTQRSCMVCHSAMRDRDLVDTPTPLPEPKTIVEPYLQ